MNQMMLNVACFLVNFYRITKGVLLSEESVTLFVLPVKRKDD